MTTPRPTLSSDPDRASAARDAVDNFVTELQAAIDSGQAEMFNAHFSDDVAWGSPYGATVVGYDALHSIHRRMFREAATGPVVTGPSSRYETVHVSAPAPDVAIAHVRRVAIDAEGQPLPVDGTALFAEMALYVLILRDDEWWLAAGQNTPIRPKP